MIFSFMTLAAQPMCEVLTNDNLVMFYPSPLHFVEPLTDLGLAMTIFIFDKFITTRKLLDTMIVDQALSIVLSSCIDRLREELLYK